MVDPALDTTRKHQGSSQTLPRVAVIGSGTMGDPERALPLGEALARLGVHLITGGGRGMMAEVARGFTGVHPRTGRSVGILPAAPGQGSPPRPPEGYPNPWVELPVMTHLAARGAAGQDARSRNHLVVLTGDVVVALPGGPGTVTEIELALAYDRPLVAHMARPEDMPDLPSAVPLAPTLDEVLAFVRSYILRRV
jgi:uncharacterized protein (TIGR00725 family)